MATTDYPAALGVGRGVASEPRYGWPDEHIHIVTNGRSLCGIDVEDEDLFPIFSGGPSWRAYVDARCPECTRAVSC